MTERQPEDTPLVLTVRHLTRYSGQFADLFGRAGASATRANVPAGEVA